MNAADLLDTLHRRAIGVRVDGDRLRLTAPREVLTADLLAEVTRHKHALIALLTGAAGARSEPRAAGGAGPLPATPADPDAIARRSPPEAPVPLAFAQRQLWFLDQLSPGNPFYNNPVAFDVVGALDVPALARALTEVVRRHESLRTVFTVIDGEPCQVVRPAGPVALPVTDLSALPGAARTRRADALVEADARAPFDLATGPLLRSCLLRLAEREHRWLLTVHHMVADGWSIGILIGEVTALYGAYARGAPSPLPEPPVQYADYTLWQRRQLGGGELERQLDYWTRSLAGAPALLALPTDRPRPAVQRYRGDYHGTTVDAAVLDGLRAVASAGDATLFMTLTAALSVLLWRYSGQDDICLGTPFANRHHRDVEGLIGHFINTVVIRNRIDPQQSFAALLADVRAGLLDAYAHPDLPFAQLVDALNPERDPSYSPLFQVMLALQNIPRGRVEVPGLVLRPVPSSTGAARFDLSVEAMEQADGLAVTFEYNTDLFDAATIARLADHFGHLLGQVAADPSVPVGALRLLAPAQRHRLLVEWNRTARPIAGPPTVVERIAAQARRHPDRLAVVCDDGRLDYATLQRRANRLAHALRARGVRADQVVGLRLGRSTGLIVAILGVLKAGAAYLPLDPDLPPQRLADMVGDAAPALVLGEEDLAAVEAEGQRDDPPGVVVHPAGLAYVIYTSGSTGRPKGVAVSHRGIVNLLDDWVGRVGAAPGDAAALWSSVGFDVSVQEIFLPLITGGALHLVPGAVRGDPAALLDWLRTHRIGTAYLPPAFVRWLAEDPATRLAGLALRRLLVGVEPLLEQDLHRIAQALPGLRVLNGYGPTEATVYSTAYLDPRPCARQCPIGRPIANTRLYLLDEAMQPVPVGVTGEIYLGGAGLARGYLGRPGLTARRFLPDPFVPAQRVYRTGDLARFLPDGNVEYLGRRDSQVKVRGFRVELGEVEAALRDRPDVREAVVLVDRDATGETHLVAGVDRGGAAPLLVSEWREALARRLPGYMVPSRFVELPRLPRTANGKLDRDEVLRRSRAGVGGQVNLASPRDQIELALYQIWQRLLRHPQIGIGDNFFDVGGTSISAIKLAHAIGEEFGEVLPVSEIMLHPTIEALGGRLRRGSSGRPPSNLIEFRPGAGQGRVICVHPAGGTAFCYLSLAKALPEQVGVYGIQSPGVNPGEEFLPTVEAMAQAYLRQVGHLLDGPVVLTGLSYGGLVAYEMGRRLARAGQGVRSVVLLDTLGTDDAARRAAVEPVDLAEFRDKLVRFNGMYPGIDDEQIDQYHRIYNHNRSTMRDYPAPPSPARLVLLQATAGRDESFLHEVRTFWRRRGADFRLEQVHCDHWDILESDVVLQVATLLRDELDRLRDVRASTPALREAG